MIPISSLISDNVLIFLVFLFGLILGSFLNVVILRYGQKSLIKGRSACPKCQKKLNWFELIPVFSYLIQIGRCRGCRGKISPQYPLVELATGIIFAMLFLKYSLTFEALLSAVIFSILILISVYDLRHKIIPDLLSFLFAFFSFCFLFLINFPAWPLWRDILAGFFFYIPFYLIWKLSDGRAMGLGDGKLAVGIGAFLGLQNGLSAIIWSFCLGAIISLLLMFMERLIKGSENITMKSEVPFGPFMILGLFLQFFFFSEMDFVLMDLSYFF